MLQGHVTGNLMAEQPEFSAHCPYVPPGKGMLGIDPQRSREHRDKTPSDGSSNDVIHRLAILPPLACAQPASRVGPAPGDTTHLDRHSGGNGNGQEDWGRRTAFAALKRAEKSAITALMDSRV